MAGSGKKRAGSKVHAAYSEMDVKANGVNLHLGRWKGRGAPVVCIHGLTANHLSFAVVAASLQEAGLDVYAPDLRGRGRSDKPEGEYSLELHARDMLAMADELGLAQFVLVGHSLGAGISIRMAAMAPDRIRGIVLIDGGGLISFSKKLKILGVIKPSLARLGRTFPSADDYVQLLSGGGLIDPGDPVVRDHIEYELDEVPGGVRCNIPKHVIEAETNAQGGSLDTGKMLRMFLLHPIRQFRTIRANAQIPFEQIRCPVLILKAGHHNLQPGDDLLPIESLRDMEARIPEASSLQFPNLNHYGIILARDNTRDEALVSFINGLPA